MHKKYSLPTFLVALFFLVSIASIDAQTINHWEMVVAASDTWHYFPGTSEPPANWADTSFDPQAWKTGPGGIGYGDGDDATIISAVTSVYLRINFNLVDTSNISWAILHVDYDDAFVAYLNGHEIARANIGTVGVKPLYSATATTDHEALVYAGGIPNRFIIHKDTLAKYMIQGDNVLAVQVHNISITSSDLTSIVYFSVGIKDNSQTYRQVPDWFNDPRDEKSNLPLLIIDTKGQTIPDEPKITANLKVVDNGPGQMNGFLDDATDYQGLMGIELHGQSSQQFPKKCYGVELRNSAGADSSVSLLGMPAESDWIFSAPYSDKSMMRNAITYQLGRKIGYDWQPRFKYCEAYLNGDYRGVYMLIEKIKRGSNRVDINKLKPDEISGDNLTGGYIVKVDKISGLGADEYFYSHPSVSYPNTFDYAFTYVTPKYNEIVIQQKSYIQNYLITLQNILNGSSFKDPVNGFRKYMDVNSFIDFQIMNEFNNNVDGYRYSTFFYKKRDSDGGKLFAGPLWDFDLCYGNVNYDPMCLATDEWLYKRYGTNGNWSMHWWYRLMEDPDYNHAFAARWKQLRTGPFATDSIMATLDDDIKTMGAAVDRNYKRWPILGQYVWPNNFVGDTYLEEVIYLKSWITDRLNWMDGNVSLSTGDLVPGFDKYEVSVFPNPVKDQLNIILSLEDAAKVEVEILDVLGNKVYSTVYAPGYKGRQSVQANIPQLAPACYMLRLKQNGQVFSIRKLLVSR